MHPPTIPFPRRFGLYTCLTLITLTLLLYTNRCMSPARSCLPGIFIFHRDLTFSFKMQLHWARQDRTSPDAAAAAAADDDVTAPPTPPDNHNNNKTLTITNKDFRVDDLYQYVLASPRVRSDKDYGKLRRYLQSHPPSIMVREAGVKGAGGLKEKKEEEF